MSMRWKEGGASQFLALHKGGRDGRSCSHADGGGSTSFVLVLKRDTKV